MGWQKPCFRLSDIPKSFGGVALHYTSRRNNGEVKKYWAQKAGSLPLAPFENGGNMEKKEDAVDAVFVVGDGSKHKNEELKYALRCVDKNCKFIRNVYICGVCPSWVDKTKVKYLKWPDRFRHAKDANIIDKLRHACEQPEIASKVLFCSDDQFVTTPCTWDSFSPRYLRRYSPEDKWYALRKRVWHSRLKATLERDRQRRMSSGLNEKDVFYYQPHIWMQIDKAKFIEYAKWCDYQHRTDTIIASGYFNYIDAGGKPDFDHTFIGPRGPDRMTTTHIAYTDGSFASAMKMLKSMFPNPSRFEIR
jgi:hypothetical protein